MSAAKVKLAKDIHAVLRDVRGDDCLSDEELLEFTKELMTEVDRYVMASLVAELNAFAAKAKAQKRPQLAMAINWMVREMRGGTRNPKGEGAGTATGASCGAAPHAVSERGEPLGKPVSTSKTDHVGPIPEKTSSDNGGET